MDTDRNDAALRLRELRRHESDRRAEAREAKIAEAAERGVTREEFEAKEAVAETDRRYAHELGDARFKIREKAVWGPPSERQARFQELHDRQDRALDNFRTVPVEGPDNQPIDPDRPRHHLEANWGPRDPPFPPGDLSRRDELIYRRGEGGDEPWRDLKSYELDGTHARPDLADSNQPAAEPLADRYPDGVDYTDRGYPDLGRYASKTVELDNGFDRLKYAEVDDRVNVVFGWETTPEDKTWHKSSDGRTVWLVATDLHSQYGHADEGPRDHARDSDPDPVVGGRSDTNASIEGEGSPEGRPEPVEPKAMHGEEARAEDLTDGVSGDALEPAGVDRGGTDDGSPAEDTDRDSTAGKDQPADPDHAESPDGASPDTAAEAEPQKPLQDSDRSTEPDPRLAEARLAATHEEKEPIQLSTTNPDHKELLNNPPPDSTVVVDERFSYKTDHLGRVVHASAKLDIVDLDYPRDKAAQAVLVGKLPGDHAGHIFARIFQGPPDAVNLTAMEGNKVNLGQYRSSENAWRRAVEVGRDVKVEVDLIYVSESARPDALQLTWWIDGERNERFIYNTPHPLESESG